MKFALDGSLIMMSVSQSELWFTTKFVEPLLDWIQMADLDSRLLSWQDAFKDGFSVKKFHWISSGRAECVWKRKVTFPKCLEHIFAAGIRWMREHPTASINGLFRQLGHCCNAKNFKFQTNFESNRFGIRFAFPKASKRFARSGWSGLRF